MKQNPTEITGFPGPTNRSKNPQGLRRVIFFLAPFLVSGTEGKTMAPKKKLGPPKMIHNAFVWAIYNGQPAEVTPNGGEK